MKANFYVYEHWRMDRDECFYVGKGHGTRAYRMQGRNGHHKAIVAKMHRIGSSVEVRIVADGLTEQEAFNLEINKIAFWIENGVDLANFTKGGTGTVGYKFTQEQKGKVSKAVKKHYENEENRKKVSDTVKKHYENEENRKKTSEAVKKAMTKEARAKMSVAKKNMSKEQREHLAKIARNMPSEQRAILAEKARNMPLEQRAKIAEKVRMINAAMTPEQRAIKSEKGRLNAIKRWSNLKAEKES